jgi:hypothetical protein
MSSSTYIERKNRWAKIFDYGAAAAVEGNITQNDIQTEIRAFRKSLKA